MMVFLIFSVVGREDDSSQVQQVLLFNMWS